MAKIGIATASTTIDISVLPSYAIKPVASTSGANSFNPFPSNPALIDILDSQLVPQKSTASAPAEPIGGLVFQQEVSINLGAATNTLVPQLLNAHLYSFPEYPLSNPSDFEMGDLVYFKSESTGTYKSSLQKIDVGAIQKGAYHGIFVFQEFTDGYLKVYAKGYIEIPNNKISAWQVGRTLYIDQYNKIGLVPSSVGESWVKSIGFCVPNKEDKKIIWFDPDTTHVKIKYSY